MEFSYKTENGVPEHNCLVPLKCPNCYKNMELVEKNIDFNGEKYDKWGCLICSHIIVLDYRGEENE
jgi:hypothetical protein